MIEILGLDHLALTDDGPTLSMGVSSGQAISVVAPAGEGKSHFLRVLAGRERAPQGSVLRHCEVAFAESGMLSRRQKPISLARSRGGQNVAATATQILMATRLWEVRNRPIAELSPGQIAACELLGPLISGQPLILIDGQLDALDPWTLRGVVAHLHTLRSQGAAVVAATHRPDIVQLFETVIVLQDRRIRFAGSIDDLLRSGPPHTLTVATDRQPGVRALVAPFSVSVQSTPEGLRFEAAEGQELAAKLLLEGYGDVRFVVDRPPTVEEALLNL